MRQCFWFIFVLAVLVPQSLFAYEVSDAAPQEQYGVVPITYNLDDTIVQLGELTGYPVMYEFTTERTVDLELQLLQRYRSASFEPVPLSLIAVKVLPSGGVGEVGRLANGGGAGWNAVEYDVFGVTALTSDVFQKTIEPGTYRVEVSTPTNEGTFVLLIGNEAPPIGYFETLGTMRAVQSHFGYSFFFLLTSPYIYYPIGIILLLVAIQRTWKYRNKITNVA